MKKVTLILLLAVILPKLTFAQTADYLNSLHGILDQLYDDVMPLCSQLIGVAQAIAGFAATWYIAVRVWRHIANAEPIDFYPLFRPFVLGFCIMVFPSVLGLINGIMKPTVTGTAAMVEGSNNAIRELLERKEEAIKQSTVWQMYVGESGSGDREKWYQYTHGHDSSEEGMFEGIGNDIKFAAEKIGYNFKNSVKEGMSQILRILFEAASLCIDTMRTFQLIVLSILGPLVFALSVFDGLQHTLIAWLARYINIFLWLPVANIFGAIIGKIQEKMIEMDISQVTEHGNTFFSETDIGYLIFMIIGIIGYFTVPSISNYIIHAGGMSPHVGKSTGAIVSTTTMAAQTTYKTAGFAATLFGMGAGQMMRAPELEDMHRKNSGGGSHMGDKLRGNSK